jgi:hypothetical protein
MVALGPDTWRREQDPCPAIVGIALIRSGAKKRRYLMFTRLRSTWLAGGGAMLLALSLSGVVAAAALVTAIATPPTDEPLPVVVDTTQTWEDLDGNGIDDDCQDVVEANEALAAEAEAAADLNADGVISTSEAAQSGRIGGTNCNHGGYVSTVAHTEDACATETGTETGTDTGTETGTETVVDPACEAPAEETTEDTTEPVVCEAAPVAEEPVVEEPVDTAPNAHGKAVSKVAQDKDAVGGKNCNHGGAVSEVAKDKAAKDARKAAHDAAKAERGSKGHGKNK